VGKKGEEEKKGIEKERNINLEYKCKSSRNLRKVFLSFGKRE
jgi:hypothetical protein